MNKFRKNKKGELEEMMKVILWVLFFIILFFGINYLIKSLTGS